MLVRVSTRYTVGAASGLSTVHTSDAPSSVIRRPCATIPGSVTSRRAVTRWSGSSRSTSSAERPERFQSTAPTSSERLMQNSSTSASR